MKEIVRIDNRHEIIGFLRGIETDARFITLDTVTPVEMRKTGNPYVGTMKLAKRNGLIGVNFVRACERRYAKLYNLNVKDVEYTPGDVWYEHCLSGEGKPLALCQHKKMKELKYLQYFPLRNIGETLYVHPLVGLLSKAQVDDMYARFVVEKTQKKWKPIVITLSINSIYSITFRKIKYLNGTANRLIGRMIRWKRLMGLTKQ